MVYPIIPVLLTGLRKSNIDTTTATAPFAKINFDFDQKDFLNKNRLSHLSIS